MDKKKIKEVIATVAPGIAGALGGSYRIKSMNVMSGGIAPPPRPVMAMRAMAVDAAPMPLEAGNSTLTVQISGQIEVSD